MSVELVPASPAHVRRIANRMRPADVIECRAAGLTPKAALRTSLLSSSISVTAMVDDRLEALISLVILNSLYVVGTPLMLGTEAS